MGCQISVHNFQDATNINHKITVKLIQSHPVNSELPHVCPGGVPREVELFLVHCSTWQWCRREVSFGLPSARLLKRHRRLVGRAVPLQPQSAGRERAPSSLPLPTATHPTCKQRVTKQNIMFFTVIMGTLTYSNRFT